MEQMQMNMPDIYDAALYLRLSKDDMEEGGAKSESNSIANQRELLRSFVKSQPDIQIFDIYVDDGYSGGNFDRPEFKRMTTDIEAGKVNCVIVKDLSRFGREYIEAGRWIEKTYPALNVRFISVTDQFDSKTADFSEKSFVVPIKNFVNESYCRDISGKVRSHQKIKREKGEFIGAFAPYGYCKDSENKNCLVIDSYAADIVRKIFSWKIDGFSLGAIAEKLNVRHVQSPKEYKKANGENYNSGFHSSDTPKWSAVQIKRILTNEVYIGNMVQGRQASESYKTKKLRTLPKEDWIRVIGTHEAIISLETWNQTQALLAVGARSFTRSEEIGLFSRKVYCGHCNKLMRTGRSKRKSGTYYNYVICVRRHPEINPCPVHAVSNALMEKTILDQLDILAAKYKDGSLFSEIMDEESTIGIEIKRLKAELAQHKKKLVEYESGLKCLYLDKASGSISNSDYQFLSRELSAGKELAERKVDLCTENYNKILRSQEILREKAGVLESYSRPKELTRSMVETFIDHIVICSSSDGTSKQEIKIYWNF